ncbi:hypothetical protein [Flagellimonas beolgyonensis]|uniref:hypothetical protein n=1 Tax=Flagellimonas beolgyonensis TaxID=864064 RepID=UPI0032599DA9
MTKKTGAFLILIAALILLILNVSHLDFSDIKKGPVTGIVSNILLILAMIINIRDMNRKV